ncbi:Inosine triphosphate pyrophosphatase family protein isoform 1 [Trypanosoma grayi]|uniref:Inosine triphosphate pyrophosphatase family protein isoform 1 n=1 Tax=Trypanosoma grayi TaxID=71804 RepID=UPI0004F40A3C|nr:Inosine triphosphate pyrophosphatase family protein isoform 1 [Trypanosoma grayi]KEG11092.1 Inosine triphosphate pyrophosphatase family protein isoform 1 [Trypanosoma grayi]
MTETAVEKGKKPMITLVTGNAGKLREVQACLAGHVAVESVKMDLPELQSKSVFEISREKALVAYKNLNRPVLVEDTMLCFEALGGLPGPYIKWFLDEIGPTGLIKLLKGFESKRAYATCVFTYCAGPDMMLQFEGRCDGKVVDTPRGEGGFGWDCIFEPDEGRGMTYAEMPNDEKNKISHRARALVSLKKHFCQ